MTLKFPPGVEKQQPLTTAEESGFQATTTYTDVIGFLGRIQLLDPSIRIESFGTSLEGRPLPLVIAGPEGVADPLGAKASGRPVVFIMANIHAGEVEGKEAALMFLRDLLGKRYRKLREKMILLIAPIYNADGNEKFMPGNRPTQLGPERVGTRENAQGLDLNRDFMKLESPEANGLIGNVLRRWDPLLTVDLHTTNGSYHGYTLTYAPTLNPNGPQELTDFSRDTLLPDIRRTMKKEFRQPTYYYGNFADQLTPEKGWFTYDSRPRFGNNYVSLRNRFVILSEAYSYIDFRSRIEVTYQFVHAIVAAVRQHGKAMMKLADRADRQAARREVAQLGTRFEIDVFDREVEILWEKCVAAEGHAGEPDPETGKGLIRRTGEIVPVTMTDYGVFKPVESSSVPWAYLVDPSYLHVVRNLLTHGIVVEKLIVEGDVELEEFIPGEAHHAGEAFQGHHELTLTGEWKEARALLGSGTFMIRTDQPLARLVFHLLEPRSDDGLFNWNFFDGEGGGDRRALPVRKLQGPAPLQTMVVSGV